MPDFDPIEARGLIERKVDELTEDCVKRTMRGDAKDFVAYASLIARHRTLMEMKEFIVDQRKQGDTLESD